MTIRSSDLAKAASDIIATMHQPNTVLQQLRTNDAADVARLIAETLRLIEIPVEDDLPKDAIPQNMFPESVTPQQRKALIAQMDAAGGPLIWAEKLISVMGNTNRDPKR